MFSYWEKQSFLSADYIVIGSGIVGLSTAAALKEQQPKSSVIVLERGVLPTGASTKNAGFACIGSLTELLADAKTQPLEAVVGLVSRRYKGLLRLRQRLGDVAIGYEEAGSYELLRADQLHCLDQLQNYNQWLKPYLGGDAFGMGSVAQLAQFGFGSSIVAMLRNYKEGQLDTGRMMRSLLQYVAERGVLVVNGAHITHIEPEADGKECVKVAVNQQYGEDLYFTARKVAICTNAFAQQLAPSLDVVPGRGQVLITEPIDNLPFKGIFHFDEGYYYFRNVGDRVLFGGGRNLDFEGETTVNLGVNSRIMAVLEQYLHQLILPKQQPKVAMSWSGIMAFGKQKEPILELLYPNVWAAVRMGGMGVALGSSFGDEVARVMQE